MKKRNLVVCGLVGLLGPSIVPRSTALAGPVTWEVAGEITRVSDPLNLLGGAVEVGTPFSFSYTFESTTPDSESDPAFGTYSNAILGVSGNVGGVAFAGPVGGRENQIQVGNGTGLFESDSYIYSSGVNIVGVDLDMGWGVGSFDVDVFLTDALPIVAPDMNLFRSFGFGVADEREVVDLLFVGRINSIVPEPNPLVLLALGALLRFRSRVRIVARAMTPETLVVCGVLVVTLGQLRIADAGDCNGDGILDPVALASPCKVDIVFLMDTSISMGFDVVDPKLCEQAIPVAITDLTSSGVIVNSQILRISPDPVGGSFVPCGCCTSSVVEVYGTTAPGMLEMLGDCPPGNDQPLEDWAAAAAIVAGNRTWTENALRFIIVMSDEPPRCGWRRDRRLAPAARIAAWSVGLGHA